MTFKPTILPQSAPFGLGAALQRVAQATPDHAALLFQGQTLTYGQLLAQVLACRRQLRAWGVQAGQRVACLALGHPLQLAALLALEDLGAIWVPLNFRLAAAEWQQVLQDCQASLLLCDDDWRDAAQALSQAVGVPLKTLAQLVDAGTGHEQGDVGQGLGGCVQPDDPLLLVYTSGTTGRPKGAVHTAGNLLANAKAATQAQGLSADDRVLTLLPLFHVGGLCIQTLPALLSGATVVLHPRFDPDAAWRDLAHQRITLCVMVPAVMRALVQHPGFAATPLPHLRALWAGSSVLPDDLVQAWLQRGVPVCNVYGATETGPFSIALGPQHAHSHVGSCGWPALGVGARLQALSDAPASDGVGEVWLRGPAIVRHYWPDRPALNDQGWFATGDLARIEPDGSWRIVGRAKDMIISGGENIYPAEIENILARHPAVAECAAIGLPDPRWGESVVAVVVLRPEAQASDADLLAPVMAALARYKHPRQLVRMTQLPKTALGKVQKDRLVAEVLALNGPARTGAAP
jgi:fatty-acyl-CoA synthase